MSATTFTVFHFVIFVFVIFANRINFLSRFQFKIIVSSKIASHKATPPMKWAKCDPCTMNLRSLKSLGKSSAIYCVCLARFSCLLSFDRFHNNPILTLWIFSIFVSWLLFIFHGFCGFFSLFFLIFAFIRFRSPTSFSFSLILSTWRISRQAKMCRRCLRTLDDDNMTVPDYASSIACTEDGDDASLMSELQSRTHSVQNMFSTPTHTANQVIKSVLRVCVCVINKFL